MEIRIVPLTACQVKTVAELEKVCFSDPWSENSVAGELDNPLSLWLVALDGDRLLGYVGCQRVPPEADVMNLAVVPEARRRGLGRRLMEALWGRLMELGDESLTLEVRASNIPAITLYEGLGFVQAGRRPNYYEKPREDALILRKERNE